MDKSRLNRNLRLLFKSSIIVFFGILLSKLLGYTYRIIVAREFGAEIYGVFSLALMISGWFITLSALGLSDGLLRYIPLYRGKKNIEGIRYLFSSTLKITAVTSILSGILLFFLSEYIALSFFHNEELIIYLRIFSILVPLTVISSPYLVTLRAYELVSHYSFIYNVLQNLTKLLMLLFFIFIGLGNKAVPLSYLIGILIMFLAGYLVCRAKISTIFVNRIRNNNSGNLNEFLSYSVPLMFFGFLSTLFYWIDSLSLGLMKGVTEVGLYNAAVPIAMLLSVAPELFIQLFFPLISREYGRNNIKLIKEMSKQVAKWVFIVNLPFMFLLILFPGAAIKILFGSGYLGAENALRILVMGVGLSSIISISSNLISMVGKSRLFLLNILAASASNILLNYLLIPLDRIFMIDNSNGLVGAAIATLISMLVLQTMFMLQARYYTGIIPLRRKMLTLVLAIVIPYLVINYLKNIIELNIFSIGLLAGLFLTLYIIFVFLLKGLDRNDLIIWKSIKDKLAIKK